MNALDFALTYLAAASSALERTARPNLKDLKEAKEKAKAAHEVLDASEKLLGRGIYTVATEPPEETPLFTTTLEPSPEAALPEEPTAIPHPLDLLLDESGEPDWGAREKAFRDKLLELENAGFEEGMKLKAWPKAERKWMEPWNNAFLSDDDQAAERAMYDKVVFAIARRPVSWEIPTDEEILAAQRTEALAEPDPFFDTPQQEVQP